MFCFSFSFDAAVDYLSSIKIISKHQRALWRHGVLDSSIVRAIQSWDTGSNPTRTKRDMTFTVSTSNGLGSVMSIPKLGVDEDIPCGRVKEGPGLQIP